MVIHHKDRNPLNDDVCNLEALTRSEHIKTHRDDLLGGKRVRDAYAQPDLFVPSPEKPTQEDLDL
jgi:hypothetical protein